MVKQQSRGVWTWVFPRIRTSQCFCFFFIYTSFLYNKIREAGAHIVEFINGISVYKCARAIDKNTTILSKVLQVCHEWTQ